MDKGAEKTDKRLAQMERKLAGIYKRANKELGQKLKEYLAELEPQEQALKKEIEDADDDELRVIAEEKYKLFLKDKTIHSSRFQGLANQMAGQLKKVNETAAAYINGEMPAIYATNYNSAGDDIASQVKGYSFELVDAGTVKSLATKDETLLPYKVVDGKKDVRWNTRAVNSEVMQGILQGDSIPKISDRLTHVTEMNLTSAVRNARTATTSAQNRGRMDSYHKAQEKGIRMVKVWLATNDVRTRDAHFELNGQERDIDEPFENSLGKIMYPGDPDADPANVYNCRCTMITRVVGFTKPEYEPETAKKDEPEATGGFSFSFSPAGSIQDAEDYARTYTDETRFGAVGVSFKGISLDVANEVNRTIGRFYQEFNVEKFGGIIAPAGNTKLGKLIELSLIHI